MIKPLIRTWKALVPDEAPGRCVSLGLLLLRIGAGLIMLSAHGWFKMVRLATDPTNFGDPIGLGPTVSLVLAGSAEFFCSILVVLGLGTRLAAVPLAFTMFVASVFAHAADPWSRKELSVVFLIIFVTLALTGPGRYSIDAKLRSRLA